jgi:hypothetical protein
MAEREPQSERHHRDNEGAETPFQECGPALLRFWLRQRRDGGLREIRSWGLGLRWWGLARRHRLELRLTLGLRSLGLLGARLRRAPVGRRLGHWLAHRGRIRPGGLRRRLVARPGLRTRLRRLRIRPGVLWLRRWRGAWPRRLRQGRRLGLRPRFLRRRRLRRRWPGNIQRIRSGRTRGGPWRVAEIPALGRQHDGNVGKRFWLEFHDPRLELRVDAPKQGTDIEIEQCAIGIHDAAGLGPGRQRIERSLLERLHHIGAGSELRGKVHFGQSGCGPKVPKQLCHLSIVAGWHFLDPVNIQVPSRGLRLWAYRHVARLGRHRKTDPISSLSPPTQAQQRWVCKSQRD